MEYVDAVRHRWLVALVVLSAVMIPTAVVSFLVPAQYSATTRLWVGVEGGAGITDLSQKVSVASDLMSTYPELVRSPLVLEPVIADLGLPTDAAELGQRVVATVPNDTFVLQITVTDEDARVAAAAANDVAAQFKVAASALPQVRTSTTGVVDTTVLQAAEVPTQPSSPQIGRNLGVAFVLGLVLAVIAALVAARYFPATRRTRQTLPPGVTPEWD